MVMGVTARFFASLRERTGLSAVDVAVDGPVDVETVWSRATGLPLEPHVLIAVNHEYADRDSIVADGDEVAFFPPVTGG